MSPKAPSTDKHYCCLHFSGKTFSFLVLATLVPSATFYFWGFSCHLLSDSYGQHFEKHFYVLAHLILTLVRMEKCRFGEAKGFSHGLTTHRNWTLDPVLSDFNCTSCS